MITAEETLNSVLIRVYRSLLQYAGECWPWTAAKEARVQQAVRAMAEEERTLAGRIFASLDARGWSLDLGNYPDNSALHYVSLDFMLQRLVTDHTELTAMLDAAASRLEFDSETRRLLSEAATTVRRNLATLRNLAGLDSRQDAAA